MRVSGRRDILALAVPILAGRPCGPAPPGFALSGLSRPVSPLRLAGVASLGPCTSTDASLRA